MKITPLRRFLSEVFYFKKNVKRKRSKILRQLTKVRKNFQVDDTIRKNILYNHEFKTERWMKTEYDDTVERYQKLEYGEHNVKREKDEQVDENGTSKV